MNNIIDKIRFLSDKKTNIMEVCGTHTMAIASSGIKTLLPKNINMISGPGCPVCVTPADTIDTAAELSKGGCIVATFGDMLRVPGSTSSLEKEKSNKCDIRIVYSCLDIIKIARENSKKEVVFIGVGFETTSPTIAATVKIAYNQNLKNLSIIPAFKLIPPAIRTILEQKRVEIDGFLLPGHVSVIIGARPYRMISEKFKRPGVITGFEPEDILEGIFLLLKQLKSGKPKIEIQYKGIAMEHGNPFALKLLYSIFKKTDARWRGIGIIKNSGLKFRKKYIRFDALKKFNIKVKPAEEPPGCMCGKILTGIAKPKQCRYFGSKCTPASPIGPCMVSSEGTCAAHYKYEKQ